MTPVSQHPPTNTWRADGLLRALLRWTSLTTLLFWLPTLRGAFDGRSYEWGLGGLHGTGFSGDYWFPAVVTIFAIWLVTRGWCGARPPFYWLFVTWHCALALLVVVVAVTLKDDLTLQGDTLGLNIPLKRVGPLLFCGVACAAVYSALRGLGSRSRRLAPPRQRIHRFWLLVLLGLLPVMFVLLRFGEPDGLTDKVGVAIAIVYWFLLPKVSNPWELNRG